MTWVDERLRGRDRDLGAGLEEDDRVGLAGDRRADRVRDRDDRAAPLAGVARRGDRVGGLARLGDRDDERLPVERRRAVAELGADGRPGRQAGPVLERGGADERRVVGAAAGDELDPRRRPGARRRAPSSSARWIAAVARRPGRRCDWRSASGCSWISLSMKWSKPPFSAASGVQSMIVSARSAATPSTSVIDDAGRPDVGDVALLEEDDPVRVGEDRRDVAGDEALLAVQAHDERHVLAGADEPADLAAVHDDERVGAVELAERRRGRRRRGRPRRPPRRGGRSPRCRSRTSACGRAPRARRGARGSSR